MIRNRLIAFLVGLATAAIMMGLAKAIESSLNVSIPEVIQGIIFASAFIAGRRVIIEHFKEKKQ